MQISEFSAKVEWETENWTVDCDFPGNEFKRELASRQQCLERCETLPDCTHYSWFYGICYIKSGRVRKEDAIPKKNFVCGLKAPRLPGIKSIDIINITGHFKYIRSSQKEITIFQPDIT